MALTVAFCNELMNVFSVKYIGIMRQFHSESVNTTCNLFLNIPNLLEKFFVQRVEYVVVQDEQSTQSNILQALIRF